VNVVTPTRPASAHDVRLPGSIDAIQQTSINARTSGYVRRLLVDIGARVTAGQLLAEIVSPEVDQQLAQARADASKAEANLGQARAALAQAKAEVANAAQVVSARIADQVKAQAQLVTAQQSYVRSLALWSKGFAAKQEVDNNRAARDAARADVGSAI